MHELIVVIERALERTRLLQEVTNLREQLDGRAGFDRIVGKSSALIATLNRLLRFFSRYHWPEYP